MNIFGFNLSISRGPSPASQITHHEKALALTPAEWLRGGDLDPRPATLSSAYEQVVWVYRAINVLAEQVANIPFLFSAGERGRENLVTSGPLLDFYARPHPQLNCFQYWELRVIWLMLRGECIRIPIFEDLNPNLNLNPSRLTHGPRMLSGHASHAASQLKTKNSKLKTILILDPARFQHIVEDGQLLGWRYTGLGPQTPLSSQVFLPEEVWFEKLPNPFDFWRGLSPLAVAHMAARTDFAASAFMQGVIENNADAGVIVRSDKPLSDEQQDQVLKALRERKRHAGQADRPVFLNAVTEIVKPQLSSADLQFLDNRKFSRAEICAAFGVPEEIVTTTDYNKYDVMAGARLNFIENRVAPLCARLEAEENNTTIPALAASGVVASDVSPDRVASGVSPDICGWFDLDSLPIMQEARRNRLAAAKTGFDMGVPFNELNRVLDLGFKPLPWGDQGYLPAKYQPLSQPSVQGSVSDARGSAFDVRSSRFDVQNSEFPARPVARPDHAPRLVNRKS